MVVTLGVVPGSATLQQWAAVETVIQPLNVERS